MGIWSEFLRNENKSSILNKHWDVERFLKCGLQTLESEVSVPGLYVTPEIKLLQLFVGAELYKSQQNNMPL